jgi:hypothetical protein
MTTKFINNTRDSRKAIILSSSILNEIGFENIQNLTTECDRENLNFRVATKTHTKKKQREQINELLVRLYLIQPIF